MLNWEVSEYGICNIWFRTNQNMCKAEDFNYNASIFNTIEKFIFENVKDVIESNENDVIFIRIGMFHTFEVEMFYMLQGVRDSLAEMIEEEYPKRKVSVVLQPFTDDLNKRIVRADWIDELNDSNREDTYVIHSDDGPSIYVRIFESVPKKIEDIYNVLLLYQ